MAVPQQHHTHIRTLLQHICPCNIPTRMHTHHPTDIPLPLHNQCGSHRFRATRHDAILSLTPILPTNTANRPTHSANSIPPSCTSLHFWKLAFDQLGPARSPFGDPPKKSTRKACPALESGLSREAPNLCYSKTGRMDFRSIPP